MNCTHLHIVITIKKRRFKERHAGRKNRKALNAIKTYTYLKSSHCCHCDPRSGSDNMANIWLLADLEEDRHARDSPVRKSRTQILDKRHLARCGAYKRERFYARSRIIKIPRSGGEHDLLKIGGRVMPRWLICSVRWHLVGEVEVRKKAPIARLSV